jgi:DNA ligase-associated metallophosphoesterase
MEPFRIHSHFKRLNLLGQQFELYAEKTAFWVERELLIVADPHFGKASTFRQNGIAIPKGSTAEDLRRLASMIQTTDAKEIVFLGDLVHAPASITPATFSLFERWRKQFETLKLTLITGNHDRPAGLITGAFGIDRVCEALTINKFKFCHKPQQDEQAYVVAGHVHPSLRINVGHGARKRLPCFYFSSQYCILPAFGSFTGTYQLTPAAGDRIILIDDDGLIELPRKGPPLW